VRSHASGKGILRNTSAISFDDCGAGTMTRPFLLPENRTIPHYKKRRQGVLSVQT
jgi:hypothetical protein